MAKYFGKVGYAVQVPKEEGSDIYVEQIVERDYYGDVERDISHWQGSEYVNDDVKLNCQISIVADSYALANAYNIRYVTYLNSKWKVSAIEVRRPRLVLNIGSVYHEQGGSDQ